MVCSSPQLRMNVPSEYRQQGFEASGDSIKKQIDVQIRWLIRRDMAEVLRIEKASFEHPWWEEDFLGCLRQRKCIGQVAEYEREIVAFMVYELHTKKLQILNMAVDPDFRRKTIGAQMINRLIDKLSSQRRDEIFIDVREKNLGGQLFLKEQGFKATSLLPEYYDDTLEDAYLMRFRLGWNLDAAHPFNPTNRLSEYFNAHNI
jgi:[ribosomal protein S18]-alanine N-acetyltransferase